MIMENSTIPVVKRLDGICHSYVDAGADLEMAMDICLNAKLDRPGTCNAMETLLVHRDIAPTLLPDLLKQNAIHKLRSLRSSLFGTVS